jgi:hypothetical protein
MYGGDVTFLLCDYFRNRLEDEVAKILTPEKGV